MSCKHSYCLLEIARENVPASYNPQTHLDHTLKSEWLVVTLVLVSRGCCIFYSSDTWSWWQSHKLRSLMKRHWAIISFTFNRAWSNESLFYQSVISRSILSHPRSARQAPSRTGSQDHQSLPLSIRCWDFLLLLLFFFLTKAFWGTEFHWVFVSKNPVATQVALTSLSKASRTNDNTNSDSKHLWTLNITWGTVWKLYID